MSMLRGFRDFIMRGNVVELAIGVTIGVAFNDLVTAVNTDFIGPLIQRASGGNQFSGSLKIGYKDYILWGAFVNSVLKFLIVAAVVYFFVVLPMNKLNNLRKKGEIPPPASVPEDIELLRQIRDALVKAPVAVLAQGAPSDATTTPPPPPTQRRVSDDPTL